MQGFTTKAALTQHVERGCADITTCKPCMPKKEDAFVEFAGHSKTIRCPYSIYADFECFTKPVSKCTKAPDQSYTDKYQKHEASGFMVYVVGDKDTPQQFKPYEYRGADAVTKFIEVMRDFETKILSHIKKNTPMMMTADDKIDFRDATCCHLCNKPLNGDKVRDHNHLTGKYRGAAHSKCNIEEGKANTKNFKIPVWFHNLKGYDSHLIIEKVGEHTSKLSVIPQNYERYVSFSYDNLVFKDTAGFLNTSLDTLVSNLYAGGAGKHTFKHSIHHCKDKSKVDLILKKGVFPYDYMTGPKVFSETKLPPKSRFYSKLNDTPCSDEDYDHAQTVWREFGIRNLGEYHDLYMTTDVLLLADVFECFREVAIGNYELDPAWYYTLPGYSWDCMLKYTGVKLDLLTDYDMHLFVERGLRGGISMISHRFAQANNKYVPGYDPQEESSYIAYLDANNLYGWAMIQSLPISDFEWSVEKNIDTLIDQYTGDSHGCFVEVDLDYPTELHDAHSDYPLAPESMLVKTEYLSPYAADLKAKLEISDDTTPKLVPNLNDKKHYVADIRNIAYYQQKGLIVSKVHRVVTFRKEKWLKPYVDFNTSMRAKATTDFEKDFYKLCVNAIFGKSMENLRNRVDIHFVTANEKWGKHATKKVSTVERKIANPLYDGHIIYNEHLTAIKMKKKSITLNKPIYTGMSILDLSKLHMFRFHYDYIKDKT